MYMMNAVGMLSYKNQLPYPSISCMDGYRPHQICAGSSSTPSNASQSDDSGLDRTQHTSSISPPLEDSSDSEDSISLIEYYHHPNLQLASPNPPSPHLPPTDAHKMAAVSERKSRQCCPYTARYDVIESALLSPSGNCMAATREALNTEALLHDCSAKPSLTSSPSAHSTPSRSNQRVSDNRFHVLSYQQVKRLQHILTKSVPIRSCHAGYPTIHITIEQLYHTLIEQLELEGIDVKDIRLNGGAATHIVGESFIIHWCDWTGWLLVFIYNYTWALLIIKWLTFPSLMSTFWELCSYSIVLNMQS